MAKGTRYTNEFKAKAVRLLTESRDLYSSETNAIARVAKGLGVAPETLRRWRDQSDATVAAETKQTAEETMAELKSLRANPQDVGRIVGSRFPHAARLPHVRNPPSEPYGRASRGAVA